MHVVRADWNLGEFGSIPVPELIVMTPWPSGSGKFVIPFLRMHSENFSPSTVPTRMAIWKWAFGPEAPENVLREGPPCVVVDAGVVEPATLAIPGVAAPPPHPARSMAVPTPTSAKIGMTLRRGISPERIAPIRLPRRNRMCYLRVTATPASLKAAEGG